MSAADALMGVFGFKRVEGGMKTDRELLELAAKAAGLSVNQARQDERDAMIDPATASLWIKNGGTAWNPLTDDGDALRLAVKLDISVF